MTGTSKTTATSPPDERQAFEIWFGRTIRDIYEPVIHEPLPDAIVRVLPNANPKR